MYVCTRFVHWLRQISSRHIALWVQSRCVQIGAVDKIYKGYLIWYNRKKYERVARMQLKIHMVTIEDLMPQDHFLRKLEKALDQIGRAHV